MIREPKFEKESISSYDIDFAAVKTTDGTDWQVASTLSIPDNLNAGLSGGLAYPTIAAGGTYIYVAWVDKRNGSLSKDIYFTKSDDGGETFNTTNRIVNDNLGTWHEKPSIAVSGGKTYVIWTDYRNAPSATTEIPNTLTPNDVFFAVEN